MRRTEIRAFAARVGLEISEKWPEMASEIERQKNLRKRWRRISEALFGLRSLVLRLRRGPRIDKDLPDLGGVDVRRSGDDFSDHPKDSRRFGIGGAFGFDVGCQNLAPAGADEPRAVAKPDQNRPA